MAQYLLAVHHADRKPSAEEFQRLCVDVRRARRRDGGRRCVRVPRRRAPAGVGDRGAPVRWRLPDYRRAVHGDQGTSRRVLDHRRRRPGRGPGVGQARHGRVPGDQSRSSRSKCGTSTSCWRRARPASCDHVRAATIDSGAVTVEAVFRREYGRCVATLIRFLGDIDPAEEAVQDAFTVAVARWPSDGPAAQPGAWIITTARNRAIDRLRRESVPRRAARAGTSPVRCRRGGRHAAAGGDRAR